MICKPSEAQRRAVRERPVGRPVMRQRWAGLLFLHWPIAPELIQARLPAGLYVDTYQGQAWLGVVPFFMEKVRPVLLPPVPGLSWFMELNVRTYVHDAQGRPGVWFFSLDCNQFLAVEIARRFFHLPYEHATMRSQRVKDKISYHCHRGARQADYTYHQPQIAAAATESTLEWFLAERYLLFSKHPDGSLFCGQVHHKPYEIADGHCENWSAEPLAWNGFELPVGAPPSIIVAKPVEVTIFPLFRLSASQHLHRS